MPARRRRRLRRHQLLHVRSDGRLEQPDSRLRQPDVLRRVAGHQRPAHVPVRHDALRRRHRGRLVPERRAADARQTRLRAARRGSAHVRGVPHRRLPEPAVHVQRLHRLLQHDCLQQRHVPRRREVCDRHCLRKKFFSKNFSNIFFRRKKAVSRANTAKKTTATFSATSSARTSRTSSSTLRSDARSTTISAATLEPTRIT